jgi:S1-C subfamily serine protease
MRPDVGSSSFSSIFATVDFPAEGGTLFLGAQLAQELGAGEQADVADRLGRTRGLEVVQLLEPGPAASAGVRVGDIVVELDGSAIEGVGDLQRSLIDDVIGRRIDLRVERNGEPRSISVTPVELTA